MLDESIQQLVVDAYRLTYVNESCGGRSFTPPTKEMVADAGRNFGITLGTLGFGDFVLDLVDLEVLDLELKKLILQQQEDVRVIRATWKDYVSRSVQYTTKAWQAPSQLTTQLKDLNLDQGINPQGNSLEQAWERVRDLEGLDAGVFTTPGDNYVAGGERTQTMDLLAARELVDGNLVTVLAECARPGPPLSIVHTPTAQRLARVRVFSGFLRGLCEYVVQRAALHTGLRPIPRAPC